MEFSRGSDGPKVARCRALRGFLRHAWRAVACLCVSFGPGLLTPVLLAPARAQTPTIDAAAGQPLTLVVAQGRILRFDQPVESVFLGDPTIADVRVVSPGVIYVYAIKIGNTNLVALSPDQSMRGTLQLRVVADPRPVNEAQRALQPTSPVNIRLFGNRVVATGPNRNIKEAIDVDAATETYSPRDVPPINTTTIPGSHQVNIRVRFAEVSRDELLAYGVSWAALVNTGSFSFGLVTGSLAKGQPVAPGTNKLMAGVASTNVNVGVLLEALQQNGIVTILAEPNITAVTGQTASFLAGGEIPVPVPVNQNVVGIEYKPFGVSLLFTPTLLPNERITMRVRPEVSSLSTQGAIVIQSIRVPALQVRRADTTVEIASGQTFAIAGLFQRNGEQDIDKFPVLGEVPVLGELFKSTRYRRNETELVILITPYLVKPTSSRAMKTPLDSPDGAISGPTLKPQWGEPIRRDAWRGYGFYAD
jgi:pilus assembly protein CpaC